MSDGRDQEAQPGWHTGAVWPNLTAVYPSQQYIAGEAADKPETNVHNNISTFVGAKSWDIFNEMPGQFLAVLVERNQVFLMTYQDIFHLCLWQIKHIFLIS